MITLHAGMLLNTSFTKKLSSLLFFEKWAATLWSAMWRAPHVRELKWLLANSQQKLSSHSGDLQGTECYQPCEYRSRPFSRWAPDEQPVLVNILIYSLVEDPAKLCPDSLHVLTVRYCVYWFAYVGSSLRSKDKAHLIIVYEPVEFSLLVFYWGFDIYIYQGYWPVVFFPCSILIWLWYQGNVGLLKWVWKCYLFFVLQEFETVLVFLFWGFWLLIHSP